LAIDEDGSSLYFIPMFWLSGVAYPLALEFVKID
jgi:hypothetical protein